MKRYILTGAPGSGKTSLLRQFECEGFGVVEEAATDVIALWQANGISEPWIYPAFVDAVARLQKQRQFRSSTAPDVIQFHDRSVICTHALARYLEHRVSAELSAEIERVKSENIFEKKVFFVRNLGSVAPTAARRISFEESLKFERIHEETYREHNFEIIFVEPGSVQQRFAAIKSLLGIAT